MAAKVARCNLSLNYQFADSKKSPAPSIEDFGLLSFRPAVSTCVSSVIAMSSHRRMVAAPKHNSIDLRTERPGLKRG